MGDISTIECGCTVLAANPPVTPPAGAYGIQARLRIDFCPLHAAGIELLTALKASAEFGHKRGAYHAGSFDFCTKRQCIAAREVIRKAEGN
jgi:hypothetical protein